MLRAYIYHTALPTTHRRFSLLSMLHTLRSARRHLSSSTAPVLRRPPACSEKKGRTH